LAPPAHPTEARAVRLTIWAAAILVLGTAVAFVLLYRSQGDVPAETYVVPFVAGYLVVMAALLIASLMGVPSPAWRMPLRAAAGGGLLVLGVLALMSVGLPLIIAGALAINAAAQTLRGRQTTRAWLFSGASVAVAVAVLMAGFAVSGRIITCPPLGSMAGGGGRVVDGPYYYDCVDGHLTYHSGTCNSDAIDANGHVTHPGC